MSPTPMTTTCPTGSTMTAMATRSRRSSIIPYTLDANDMRFATPQGFNSGDQFFAYLKDSFDTLYAEGKAGPAGMMSIGLHCRLVGRPGRAAALKRFIDYVKSHDKVWLARRIDIADHWREHHPYRPPALRPSRMDREDVRRRHSAASSSIRPGSPSAPSSWSWARRMTAPAACTMRSAASSARPARPSGSACSTPTPTLPASWRRPSG